MSFILDALKKSDQQRQRGHSPTLPTAFVTVPVTRKRPVLVYVLLAVLLLFAGIVIGWLRPWQMETTVPVPELTREGIQPLQQVAHLTDSMEKNVKSAPELPKAQLPPVPQNVVNQKKAPPTAKPENQIAAPVMTQQPVKPIAAPEIKALPMEELPPAIQQEIPPLIIQMHAYSSKPEERLVSINSRTLREGGYLNPDIRLEHITPDGMIFSYKGYVFKRGAR